jgi:peroxiredoxin
MTLRPLFIGLLIPLLMVAVIHSAIGLSTAADPATRLAWAGALLSTGGFALLFATLFLRRSARTSRTLPLLTVATVAGSALALLGLARGGPLLPTIYAVGPGLLGSLLYTYWYSRLPRAATAIRTGQPLPRFDLLDAEGAHVSSSQLAGQPALWMFYRGNWCPLCMAQIKEVADRYRELAERGVRVLLISPQPAGHSRALAERFDVPMQFLVDPGNRAARALGLAAPEGVPLGMQALGYDTETVLPTVLLTDAAGTVLWVDQTDNYRIRPEPDTFFAVLDAHGLSAPGARADAAEPQPGSPGRADR